MKLSVEGTKEEIKEILSAICNSQEYERIISIENSNGIILKL